MHVPAGGWHEYLAGRSPNFRGSSRAGNARSIGKAASELPCGRNLARGHLDTLFALHRSRWGSRTTDFVDSAFHREVARTALERRWLRLWLLELDDRPVAAWHGFQVGDVASYYQAGRDPAYEQLSVGFVLLAHTLRAAIAEGATEYRMGRGDEAFNTGSPRRIRGSRAWCWPEGTHGRATLGCGRVVQRVRGRRWWRKRRVAREGGQASGVRRGGGGISTRRAP